MQIEEWKPVPGYEGLYEVSDHGQVKSLPKRYSPNENILNPITGRDSYYHSYSLSKESVTRLFRVHELVMMAFNPKAAAPDLVIRHLDGDPLNNRLDNLCWGTNAENKDDQKNHGTWGRKLTDNEVEQIYVLRLFGETLQAIADRYRTTKQTICQIYSGKTWKHVYAEFFNTYDTN